MKNYFESETKIIPFSVVEWININDKQIEVKTAHDYNSFPINQLANYKHWLDIQAEIIENKTFRKTFENYVKEKTKKMSKEEMFEYLYGNFYAKPKEKKSNHSEIPTSCSCSEKPNDKDNPKNTALQMIKEMQVTKQSNGTEIPQVKWLIECWEAVYGKEFDKLTDDDTTVEFLEDFLHDCLGILDYAGALNNINKGDLGNRIPDVGKTMLSREQVVNLLDNVNIAEHNKYCKDCMNCKFYGIIMGNFPCTECHHFTTLPLFMPNDECLENFNKLINEEGK